MMSWNASYRYLVMIPKTGIGFLALVLMVSAEVHAFQVSTPTLSIDDTGVASYSFNMAEQQQAAPDTIPQPREVMFKSVKIPGWGQVVNQQIWKVPIVYGLIGGIGYYSYWVHEQYKDYRAAAYNADPETDDEKFGPTPSNIPEGQSLNALRDQRNFLRNRRDLSFILIFAAYGLNVVDAYVFAHFRDFDVSDDLSANFDINPVQDNRGNTGAQVSLTFNF